MNTATLARVPTGVFPTPLQKLPRLSEELRREIWVKRDDLSGLALGGNKARKLQFLIADALDLQADTMVATGYVQSNNVVQTAAAARRYGLHAVLALTGKQPNSLRGNLVLADYFGAEIVFGGDMPQMELLEETAAKIRARGGRPYVLPPGGSTAIGIAGFVEAAFEAKNQWSELQFEPDCIVFPTGTGGTQAGLALGLRLCGWSGVLYGISTGKTRREMLEALPGMATTAGHALGHQQHFTSSDFVVDEDFFGAGYARPEPDDYAMIGHIAELEGLLLDPVYTGRAMNGLVRLQKRGELPGAGPILFWHTGGTAALFAFDRAC